jgi:STE24 endopeptidase
LSEESHGLDEATQRRAKRYFHGRLAVSLCKSALMLVLALLVLGLRLSVDFQNFAQKYVSEPSFVLACCILIGFVAVWLVSLPFDYYEGYVWEHMFGLSVENVSGWFRDNVMSAILYMLVVFAFAEGAYNFMWLNATYWWFFVWLVSVVFIVLAVYIEPIWIMPLFYKFHRLKDEELLSRLTGLADKAGIKIMGVFEMKSGAKTRKVNAGLTGIGNTRRMYLYDTLLSNFSTDEIETAMGHEMGHHIHGDIWKSAALISGYSLLMLFLANQIMHAGTVFFAFQSFDSSASLPLLALIFGLLYAAFVPLMNTLSRRWEGRADQYALDLVGKPNAFISLMIKMCNQNLRYAHPNRIVESVFYNHPSPKRRIEHALAYKKTTVRNS